MTSSEKLFEHFCDANGVAYKRIEVAATQTPDYEVQRAGVTVLVEIKELRSNDEDEKLFAELEGADEGEVKTAAGWSGAAMRIRSWIDKSVKQLKAINTRKHPAVLLLFDNGIFGGITASDIRDAMYGGEVVSSAIGPGGTTGPISIRLGTGGRCQPKLNTSLSAVALIRASDESPALLELFHNAFARVSLPTETFSGIATQYSCNISKRQTSWPPWTRVEIQAP